MSDLDVQLNLRLPKNVRDGVARAAKKNRRSTTAEVIVRLEESLMRDGIDPDTGGPAGDKLLAQVLATLLTRLEVAQRMMEAQEERLQEKE